MVGLADLESMDSPAGTQSLAYKNEKKKKNKNGVELLGLAQQTVVTTALKSMQCTVQNTATFQVGTNTNAED